MAARLTTFSKLLITFLILGLIFLGGYWIFNNTSIGQKWQEAADGTGTSQTENTNGSSTNNSPSSGNDTYNNGSTKDGSTKNNGLFDKADRDKTLRVQLVTWGGYAPGLYYNEGAAANTNSRFYKDYGFKVEFVLQNDLINALNAWIAGEYDVIVQTADAFPLYTGPNDINQYNPKAFMQVDWSRGGDAIIVKRGINTINDLKGKTVAVAVPSPAQTLLFSSLEAAGLSHTDVNIIKTSDNLKAAELFRTNDVDAAVVWSPDDIIATQDVAGSKILLTTREQTNIIADIMLAKDEVIKDKQAMFNGFYEGWMKGVAELKNKANQPKAAKYLADLFQIPTADAQGAMDNVYWTGHGDNLNFFGLERDFKGVKGQDLYSKMSRMFVETGDAESDAPQWRSVINTSAVRNAKLAGNQKVVEEKKTFKPATAAEKALPAFATKPIKINFATGKSALTENAKTIIDLKFADVIKQFGGVKVRVEGNTDSTGSRATNKSLSQARAQAVVNYLTKTYTIDKNRFIIVGNGPDKPVTGCESNATEECRARNRRTEFQLVAS